jgi:cation/acetate symporter
VTAQLAQAQGPVDGAVGNVGLNIGIFAAFVLLTLVVVYRASRSKPHRL